MSNIATRFKPGYVANPRGRKRTLLMSTINHNLRKAAQTQLAGRADEIVQLAVEKAASGDSACIAAVLNLMMAVVEPTKKPAVRPTSNSQTDRRGAES
ncbi:hypothetical protein DyAD56_16260 [Dyella sp. AD56]|uniref:DUF5681 domain-containing protein n=1 Tax=Dyella sp. AD56 TaxID=1528744 RepID=UPI000C858C82|nr:DUF5681 domain-containing protein [Dyella sp. AD56]PMQ04242.1 hypothetical protein DyAD56_16260 [Dyella sp. AD56]